VIFIDRSIPRSVADALKLVGREDVRWLEDEFAHNTPDEVWIPVVAERGWVAISRDKKIRTRMRQRSLVREYGLGCFILQQRQNLTRWDYLKLLAANLDEWERKAASTPRPFMFLVGSDGTARLFAL